MKELLQKYLTKKNILIGIIAIIAFCILAISLFILIHYIGWNKDKDEIFYELKSLKTKIETNEIDLSSGKSIKIYDKNQKMISNIKFSDQSFVHLYEHPSYIVDLLILKEDRDFFKHNGVNLIRIAKTMLKNIRYGKIVGGGSTLTQQVSKLLFTNRERSIKRKMYELFTSLYMEKALTKSEILEIYCNIVYLGFGRYGFEQGSLFYFGKHVSDLTLEEAIMLVSIISAPERFTPLKNLELAKKKFHAMAVVCKQYNILEDSKLEEFESSFWKNYDFSEVASKIYITDDDKAPWVTAQCINYLENEIGLKEAITKDIDIYTTLDLNNIDAMNKAINDFFPYIRKRYKNIKEEDFDRLELSGITIDIETGEILSFVGGKRYSTLNQFNRAFKMQRQTGSIIKPFIYGYGMIERVISPITMIEDKAVKIEYDNKVWEPKNYGNKYYGNIPIYKALQKSLNSVAAQIGQMYDLNDFIKFYQSLLKFTSNDIKDRLKPYPSIALGAFELSPLEIASAYCPIANGGKAVKPHYLNKVFIDNIGYYKYEKEENLKEQVMDEKYSEVIKYMMKYPLEKGGTAYYAKIRNDYPYQAFGKTGTTNNGRDSWFVIISGNVVNVFWVGFDKGDGRSYLTGSSFAADLTFKYMKNAYKFHPKIHNFDSDEVMEIELCQDTLLRTTEFCKDTLQILLLKEDIPFETCNKHVALEEFLKSDEEGEIDEEN